ncbi:helix-turn-helix domain-containing protein [Streptomyces roseochromogenus]|nr:helix-turn-helix domain-containing protein [Streptomyces roseochromogenus]
MDTEDSTGPPPEATLIRIAREARGWSPEHAAARMTTKYSGSSWRQMEAGYRGRDRKPVKVKAPVLAAMAFTVGVTPDRLEEVGRKDAAAILREVERQEAQVSAQGEQPSEMPPALRAAPPHVRRMIDAALEDVDPEDRADVLREMAADYETVRKRRTWTARDPQRPRHAG